MKLDETTRSARYFMGLFGKNTIQEAVEVAAERMREEAGLLRGLSDFGAIPVDLEAIACRRKLFLKFPAPLRVSEVPGADHRDPFHLGPSPEGFGRHVPAGRPGIPGVNMEIRNKLHCGI